MNRLDAQAQAQIVRCLVEGNSIRATCRMTGVAKGTVLKLLADLGTACDEYQDRAFRKLACKRIQCDEIWSLRVPQSLSVAHFCHAKDKNVPSSRRGEPGVGSIWTWTALDADTKLIVTFHVGTRDANCANHFMHDLASRLNSRVQLTTDGHKAYLYATALAFDDIDYGMLIKLYGPEPAGEGRYSSRTCIGTKVEVISGEPDLEHISTNYVGRQNLTMRMSMRHLAGLTNVFSKKAENLERAVALHFMHYNFCRAHQTLTQDAGRKTTPAMAAGVADHVWTVEELLALMPEPTVAPWGSIKRAARVGAAGSN